PLWSEAGSISRRHSLPAPPPVPPRPLRNRRNAGLPPRHSGRRAPPSPISRHRSPHDLHFAVDYGGKQERVLCDSLMKGRRETVHAACSLEARESFQRVTYLRPLEALRLLDGSSGEHQRIPRPAGPTRVTFALLATPQRQEARDFLFERA